MISFKLMWKLRRFFHRLFGLFAVLSFVVSLFGWAIDLVNAGMPVCAFLVFAFIVAFVLALAMWGTE